MRLRHGAVLRSHGALSLGLCLLLVCWVAPAWAQGHPQLVGRPNTLRSPTANTAPRLPLGLSTRSNYGEILRRPAEGLGISAFLGALSFWRKGLSPLDGQRGDLAPATSLYSVEAFKRHGVVLGFVLTAERLIHEPDVVGQVPWFEEGGRRFYLDSLSDNTWWLPEWLR